jgi:cystathionine beta-lyase
MTKAGQRLVIAGEDTSDNIFSHFSLEQLRARTSEKWRCYDADVLPLWVAEMDAPLAPAIGEELNRLVSLGDAGYESDVDAARYLAAYKGFAQRRWGVDSDVSHARTTADVISGVRAAIVATLGHRDVTDGSAGIGENTAKYEGTVIVQTPVYPPFLNVLPKDYTLETSPLRSTDHRMDFENLEAIFARVSAHAPSQLSESGYNSVFVLCSPHNPTGTVFEASELSQLVSLCERYHVQLIADEIHSPIVVENPARGHETGGTRAFTPLLSLPQAQKAIVAVSASKGFSLPGFKAALLLPGTDQSAIDTVARLEQESVPAGAHIAINVHAAAFEKGDQWLDSMIASLAQNERIFKSELATLLPEAELVLGQGTYLAFVDFSAYVQGTRWEGKAAAGLLTEARVAFNPGDAFGGPAWGDCVRVNLATNPTIIVEAVRRASQFVRNL